MMQVGCQHFPDMLPSILEDVNKIFTWVEEEIKK
jgi:hypothetical protein